jgi:hypothetical protein
VRISVGGTIMKTKNIVAAALVGAVSTALVFSTPHAWAQVAPVLKGARDTRIGKIEFDLGFPSKRSITKLYDELDFQRASQAYIWGLPIVGFAEWQHSAAMSFGAGDLDYVMYLSVEDKLGILTPNATTPYILAFSDLSKTGPLVVEVPPGPSAGGVLDFWQRPITDTGFAGPDKGEGGKYPSQGGCMGQATASLSLCSAGQSALHSFPEAGGPQVEPGAAARVGLLGTPSRYPQP